jgi:hypothetical protein
MRIRKTLIAALALAIAVAFSPLPELQAASLVGPGSQPGTDNLIQTVKAKKKAKKAGKKKGKKGKKARSKAGKCGTYMYFSKKTKKCMDARKK